MSEFQLSCKNSTPGFFNSSWSGWHHYQVIGAAETIILPSLIGVICSTGLVGNILIVFTIIRTQKKTIPDIYICNLAIADLVHIIGMPFLIHQWARGGEWVFGSPLCTIITSLDASNQFTCSAIMTAMSLDRYIALVQPFRLTHLRTRSKTIRVNLCLWVASLILMFPVWVYSKVIKFKDGLESCAFDLTSPDDVLCYTTSIPRQRVMRLTKMVLALVSVFVVSAAPFHVIQLMNLQVSQPTLTFYMSYYVSICFSYASSSINPFLYILLSGNFQKRLRQCTNVDVRMAERDVNTIENTPQVKFLKGGSSSKKNAVSMSTYVFIAIDGHDFTSFVKV
ncbi:melanin-concentrating hormone receptor 2 [Patagioenas fasciata monilis]|uniref:Melanin-concentrating hormone receptor 2 n=1 Tax=Patagioenas fasciata monilis TaxID=372326 RepID=A0A1V4JNE5_PATFA|nr:melanin-concentrating hormone receptor 2 [Patagioenas fasciata monilis]